MSDVFQCGVFQPGVFQQECESGGARPTAGDDGDPWWLHIPQRELPPKVEAAIEAAAVAPAKQAEKVLERRLRKAKVEWSDEYLQIMHMLRERELRTLAALANEAEAAREAANAANVLRIGLELKQAADKRRRKSMLLMLMMAM